MFINNNWNKAKTKYPLEILYRIMFLLLCTFVEIIVSKDPPKFVNPWNNPKNLREKFIFFILIFLFFKFLIFRAEKAIKIIDIIRTKFILFWM